jgi:FecR protein
LVKNRHEFYRRQKTSNQMKKPFTISLCLGSFLVVSASHAADLKQSKFTQVVNDVRVISAVDNFEKPAVVNAVFNMPDLVRTGVASRAELVAADDTITRVGANTIFSFDPANRTIDLQQGSLLFHSPKGKGGGTIRTGSATASVLGTTIIVTTTRDGSFKVIDLEGHVAIQFLNGLRQNLNPGQMTFVLHDGHPAPIINIRLDKLTSNSKLVQGFEQPLPSWPLILEQIADQVKLIQSGQAQDTGLLVGDQATRTTVQVVDANTIQSTDEPPAPPAPPPAPGTIDSSTLPTAYIVSSPFTAGSFTFPFGFSAPNITIGTPTIDLTPYSNVPEFAFVAPNGTLTTKGSVAFNGLSSTAILDLYAQQFSFASGSTIEADVGTFNLYPQTATTLNGVAIVDMASAASAPGGIGTLAVASSPLAFPKGGIIIDSPAAFSLTNGSSINAPNLPVHLFASSIGLNKSSVQGGFVGLNGAQGVSLTNGSTATATSGNLGILTNGGDVSLSASTLTAKQGAPFNGANTGEVFIDAVGGAVNLTSGAKISAADSMMLDGNTGISVSGSNLTASGSVLELLSTTSGGTISVTGNSILTNTNSSSGGIILLWSDGALTANGATFNADPTAGLIAMSSNTGSINVQNASLAASSVSLTSGLTSSSGSITVNNTSITAGTLSLMSGINIGSIDIQNSAITTSTPLTLTSGATSGTVTIDNSSAQSDSTTLSGATGVSIANGSTVGSTSGNLDISTTGGGINISASTLNAIAGPTIGDSSSGVVDIAATGGAVNISNGTLITANQLSFASDTGISISGASSFTSEGGIFIEGDPSGASAPVSVTGNSTLTSGTESNLVIQAGTALTVNGATLNADPIYGSVYMSSDTGSVSVQNASINSGYIDLRTFSPAGSVTVQSTAITTNNLTLNSGDGILLDCNGLPPIGTGANPQVNLTDMGVGGSSLTVNHTDFSSFPTVNMTAHTINLSNTNFGAGSTVNLASFNGQLAASPNTGAVSQPGYVNFIIGVTYGGAGNPAQSHVNFSAPGVGINISTGPY